MTLSTDNDLAKARNRWRLAQLNAAILLKKVRGDSREEIIANLGKPWTPAEIAAAVEKRFGREAK